MSNIKSSIEHTSNSESQLDKAKATIEWFENALRGMEGELDLMHDEFIRIKNLTENREIIGLCDRACSRIRQNVPLIEQLEKVEKERDEAQRICGALTQQIDESAYDNYSSVCMELSQANQQLNELKELCAIFDEYLGPVHGADVPLMTRLRDVFSGLLNAYLKLRAKQLPPD